MKTLKSFAQFINESLASDVESTITSTIDKFIDDKARARAKTFLNLDFNTVIKPASINITKLITEFGTKINTPNLDPLTIPAEAIAFRKKLYGIIGKQIDTLKANSSLLAKAALLAGKSTWKAEFLKQNSGSNLVYGNIYDIVFNILTVVCSGIWPAGSETNKDNDAYWQYIKKNKNKGIKAVRKGSLVKSFTLPLGNDSVYGSKSKPLKSRKYGDDKLGCFTGDYCAAAQDQLDSNCIIITQDVVNLISSKLFG